MFFYNVGNRDSVCRYLSQRVLPSYTSDRHFLQGRSTNSPDCLYAFLFITDLTLVYDSHLIIHCASCSYMFPLPLSVICMHLHAGTAHESITSTRSYDEFVYVHFPSLMKTNTSGVALRCCVKTPAVVVRIFLRLSINHHSLCKLCAAQAVKLRGEFVPHPRPPRSYGMKTLHFLHLDFQKT